ncbi:dirigent protein 2-like [Zingiber officinale]|uniref:dirigent protein 2-like n=1 Tax=Zingiber officinale TaxID=94328 RepID=UPI001C4D7E6A|nr:dirigent protein 2-like [Zingiber officinale]
MMKMAVSSPSFLLFIILSLAVVAFPQHRSTHLHFYVLSRFFGSPNPTVTFSVILHLESPMEDFGNLGVFDDIIIAGLDPSSPVIGRAQGSTANTDLTGHSSTSTINLVFTAGEYNGSSLMVLGRVLMGGMSDRSITGGTGLFRLARGYVLSQVVNVTGTTVSFEFDVYVTHHEYQL